MKTKSIVMIMITALLPVAGLIHAQQPAPPAPPVPPVPPMPPGQHDHHDRGPKVPVIFLGVESSPVPSVLCEQMGLPKGFGLVVDYIVPDSPAAAAGLQQNDIMKMLNDQILMEPNQLRKLLQSFQDGSTVTITVLRKGQEQKITVKLTKKDVPKRNASMPGMGGDWGFDFNFDPDMGHVDMGDLKERLQEMKDRFKEQAAEQRDMIHDAVIKAHEEVSRASEEVRRAAGQLKITNSGDTGLKTTRIDIGKAQIVFSDDKGELRLETLGGKKILTAKDPKGLLLFSGPVETKEDLDKLPAEVRQRFEKLQERDLPSVVSSNESVEDEQNAEEENSGDMDEGDDEGGDSTEQVATSPQLYPRSVISFRTILI
jgi:PDZ domain-containing protein